MSAAMPIMETLNAAGLSLSLVADGRVRVTPADRLTGELANLIRVNKPALVDWLQAANDPSPGEPDRWCWPAVQDLDAPMNPGEVETFTARVFLFMRRGLAVSQAEALTDKLKRRDRDGDDRRCCLECRNLTPSARCTQWRGAGLATDAVQPLRTKLQRCPAFLK